jgi:hypothetical protein
MNILTGRLYSTQFTDLQDQQLMASSQELGHAIRVREFLIGRGTVLKTTPPAKKHAFAICKFRWSVQVMSWPDFMKHQICRQIRSK